MREIRWERVAAILISVLSGTVIAYLLLRYALPLLLPFLLAWLVSLFIRPLANKASARLHLPRGLCAVVLLLAVFGFGAWGIYASVMRLIAELGSLIERLLADGGIFDAMDSLMLWTEKVGARLGFFSEDGLHERFYEQVVGMIGNMLSSVATRLPELAAALFSALPAAFFFLVVSVIACFYFCTDGERIMQSILSLAPRALQEKMPVYRQGLRDVFRKYVKAYGLLLLLTFSLLFIGLLILGVDYAFLLAFLIALADLLPVIGVGTILIPWGIVMLLQRQFYLGFGLLILFLVISLIRQVAEPKVLGKSFGLHPLLTLFATYVGFSLFGLLGMILAPIVALLGKRLLSPQIKKSE